MFTFISDTYLNMPVYLNDYAARTPSETVIRGHKHYWHKGDASLSQIQESDPLSANDTQHTRIQPLRSGVKFHFRIDFENLLPAELGALLWVLNVAANDNYRLKIGMGKPLGMGAIKLTSDLFLMNRISRYQSLFAENTWETTTNLDSKIGKAAQADFERFVLKTLKESSAKDLAGVERIKMLLNLLSWPGPDPEKTRYMEIERRQGKRKVNEYRGRPVLPLPSIVAGSVRATESKKSPVKKTQGQIPPGYQSGTVKKFGGSYGFIQPDSGEKDIFVHQSGLAGSLHHLNQGDRVIFKVKQGDRGPAAHDVKLIR